MLQPPGLNSKLKARPPIEKVSDYRATGLYSASETATMVEDHGWGLAQIEQREKKLLAWVRQTWA
jgi:hypothetical protein